MSEWTPEQGDEAWEPDPDRPAASYSDTELRFGPLYRRVKGLLEVTLPYPPSEADILAETRSLLERCLTDDEPCA